MDKEEFAQRIERIRVKLYKTALTYLGNEVYALDVVDEAVYKALLGYKRLRQPEYFDTWITRILINECYNELKRQSRYSTIAKTEKESVTEYDSLPLKEAIRQLPKELKDVVVLRFFSGYSVAETANALEIPVGTVSTRQRRALKLRCLFS